MAKKSILIVEDEQNLLELLEYALQKEGFDTIGFLNTSTKLKNIFIEENIALILMDRNLGRNEGSEFIDEIRNEGINTPVIYLSAKNKDEDILQGFEKHADDYITKPFKIPELIARINALIKRTNTKDEKTFKIKDIKYQALQKSFEIDEKELILSPLEHDLLLFFMKNRGILLSRDFLLENIWDDFLEKKPKTVNVAIKRLKEKIDPKNLKNYIKSVRGEGYIFC